MAAAVFDLTARTYTSRVLARHAEHMAEQRAMRPRAAGENAVTTNLTADELSRLLGVAGSTAAGVSVTPESAMRVATVYACVALIAGAIATLPLKIFERSGKDRQATDHDYWWMLNEQANDDMTSAAAWEYLMAAKLFEGDGFAELLRPSMSSSRVIGWQPLHPCRVQPFRSQSGTLYYRYQPPGNAEQRIIDAADMIHLPSLGFDGLRSPSPITYAAREAIGVAVAADRFNGKFFSGGATFDYALKVPGKLNKEQTEALIASLMARDVSSRSPLILSGGLEPAQLSVNPKDAEVLGTGLLSREDICRALGVPPHMVGHTEKTTSWGSGVEQQGIGFVRYTLQRHLTPIAQEFNRKLWPTRSRYFVEHVTAALERGNLKERYEAYRIALGRAGEQPWMDADEVRRIENLPPSDQSQPPGGAGAQPTDPALR